MFSLVFFLAVSFEGTCKKKKKKRVGILKEIGFAIVGAVEEMQVKARLS